MDVAGFPFASFFIAAKDIPASAIIGQYDLGLTSISFIQATLGSFLAITILSHINQNPRAKQWLVLVASFIMGMGIWTMHFTGMLAYDMDMVHSYNPLKTVLSALPAFVFSWVAFNRVYAPNYTIRTALMYAPFLGLGVAFMHYGGMFAMDMDADLYHTPLWFTISIVIAVTASAVAMQLLFLTKQLPRQILIRIIISAILGVAVCGLHYSAMMGAVIVPHADCRFDPAQDHNTLAMMIIVSSSMLNIICFVLFMRYTAQGDMMRAQLPKWHYLYYALGLLVLINFVFYYKTNDDLSKQYQGNVGRIKEIIHLENDFTTLSTMIRQLNEPGNDIFNSQNPDQENAKIQSLTLSLNNLIHHMERDIDAVPLEVVRKIKFVQLFNQLRDETVILEQSSNTVIEQFRAGHIDEATRSMGSMDRLFGAYNDKVAAMSTILSEQVADLALETSGTITNNQSKSLLVFGLSALAILFSLFYGTAINRRMRRDLDEKIALRREVLDYQDNLEEKIEVQTRELRFAKETAELASEAKSNFLATMTHELRTPLNSIIGMLRFMRDTPLDSEQQDMLETVTTSSDLLLQLINNILDFAKVEAGEARMEYIGFDFLSVIQRAYRAMQPLAIQKHIALELETSEEIMTIPYLLGDPLRLTQIVTNLLSNAVKFTDTGSVTMAIRHEVKNEKYITICIDVIDTGIGIPDHKINSVFDKFSQVDSSTTRQYGGTGLGLAITHKIVRMMDGTINLCSEVGVGTTFSVRIPFETTDILDRGAHNGRASGVMKNATLFQKSHHKIPMADLRILIAEDHPLNQIYVRKIMERFEVGYYKLVENGALAVEAFKAETYDLILMDCFMPIQNGYDATRAIRAHEDTMGISDHIPIIAMTANAISGDSQKCFDAGMTAYVPKPIDVDELRFLLSEWVLFDNTQTEPDKSAEQPVSQSMPVNLKLLQEFAGDDTTLMAELVAAFIVQSDINIETLRTHYNVDGACTPWVEAAHMLKGGAGNMGADTLRALCATAQDMITATAPDRTDMFTRIETAYLDVKHFLRDAGFAA